jgi:inner membrane protein
VDPLTHAASGLLLSQMLPAPSRVGAALAGLVLTFLPDIDYFLVYLDRLAFIRHHRGFTHSLVALPLFALLVAVLGRLLAGPRWFRPLFLLGLAILGAHLLLDLATSYGTMIFSPFTRRKFTLDWVFIIDPYLTALLAAGAAFFLFFPLKGYLLGGLCLAAAAAYFLLCGVYHHQALTLARQVFRSAPVDPTVAALPQPFSCRRWLLVAAGPQGIRQAFVALPYGALLGRVATPSPAAVRPVLLSQDCRAPAVPYQPPESLVVQHWSPAPLPPGPYPPETRHLIETFLEFARFPLLHFAGPQGDGQLLQWLDLRFSVPGRPFPFVLQLRLDGSGRLEKWALGRCGGGGP